MDGAERMDLDTVRKAAVDAVAALTVGLGNPTTLREVGAREEDLPALAQAAFDDVCAGGNPRQATVDQIQTLYRSVY